MEDYKSKLLQVFNYAKALNEVKNPIINDIENQRWSLLLLIAILLQKKLLFIKLEVCS